ncbi:hypothetical protein C5L28_001756 [Lentilactobacillus parakefiri]|uniref:Two-component system response regulator n=1 Tax=Lentilactobacillus parakefiri TaxID=152332 RepID=A0A224VCV3_9LACO|nr:winged helix family two component transcriptional regulator [Lentilactobacillus parakefiri DSM 10551]TDG90479.1 hypothetical protein C5L28_001756 [Lentilactobacillus parakefiri]GAW72765.1 two-component system response regulator [Lentilactobacillus parakefiri]
MKKVLVVDDEPAIVTLLEYNLKQANFEVQSATNGVNALSMAETGQFDIVLLDLMLPQMSGEEVLKQLRMDRNDTPVILLTAKDTEFDKVFGLEWVLTTIFPNPSVPEKLLLGSMQFSGGTKKVPRLKARWLNQPKMLKQRVHLPLTTKNTG